MEKKKKRKGYIKALLMKLRHSREVLDKKKSTDDYLVQREE